MRGTGKEGGWQTKITNILRKSNEISCTSPTLQSCILLENEEVTSKFPNISAMDWKYSDRGTIHKAES